MTEKTETLRTQVRRLQVQAETIRQRPFVAVTNAAAIATMVLDLLHIVETLAHDHDTRQADQAETSDQADQAGAVA